MAKQSKDVSDLGILLAPLDTNGALGGSDFFDQLDQLWREAKAPPLRGTDRHHPPQGFTADPRGNIIPISEGNSTLVPSKDTDIQPKIPSSEQAINQQETKYTGRAIAALLNKFVLPKDEEKAKLVDGRPLSALTETNGPSLAASARLGGNSISMAASAANFSKETPLPSSNTPQGSKKGKKGKPNLAEEERLRQLEAEQKEKDEREKREQEEAEAAELIRNRPRDLWVENALAHREEAEAFARALQKSFEWAQKRADYFKQRPAHQYLIEDVLGENIADPSEIPASNDMSVDAIAYSTARIRMLEETWGYKVPRGMHLVGKDNQKPKLEDLSAAERSVDDAHLLSLIQQHTGSGDVGSKEFVCAPTLQSNIETTRHKAQAALDEEAKKIAEAEHLQKISTASSTAARGGLAHSPRPPKDCTVKGPRSGGGNNSNDNANASLNNISLNFNASGGSKTHSTTAAMDDDPTAMIETSTSMLVFPHSHPFHTYTQKVVVWNRDKCKRRFRLHQSPSPLIKVVPLSCGIAGSKSRRAYDPSEALVSGETLEFEVSYTPTTAAPAEFIIKIGHAREVNSAKGMDPNTVWCDTSIKVTCSGAKPELELVTHPHSSLPICPSTSAALDLSVEPNPSFVKSTKLRTYLHGKSHSMVGLSSAIAEIRKDCTASVGKQAALNLGSSIVDVSATVAAANKTSARSVAALSHLSKGNTMGKKSPATMTMGLVKEQAEVDAMAQEALLSIAENNYISLDPCFLYSRVIKRVKFFNAGSSGRFVLSVNATEIDEDGTERTPFRIVPSELTVQSGSYAEVDIYFEPRQPALYTAGFIESPSQMYFESEQAPLPRRVPAALNVTAWLDHDGTVDTSTSSTFTVGIETISFAPSVAIDSLAGTSVGTTFASNLLSSENGSPDRSDNTNNELLASVSVVHFKDACVGHTSHRTITVTNTGPIPVDFVWDTQVRKNTKTTSEVQSNVEQQTNVDDTNQRGILSIAPVSGTLKANSSTAFTVSLAANDISAIEGLLKLILLGLPDPALCIAREEGLKIQDAEKGEDEYGDSPQHRLMTRAMGDGPVQVFSRAKPIPLLTTASATDTDPFIAFRQLYGTKSDNKSAPRVNFTATGGGAMRNNNPSNDSSSVRPTAHKLSEVANATMTATALTDSTIIAARQHFSNALVPTIASLCDERQQQHAITVKDRRQSNVFRPSILKGSSVSGANDDKLLHFYPTAFVDPTHVDNISAKQVEVDELVETLLMSRSPLFLTAVRCLADPMTSAVSVTPSQIVDKLACLVGCENLREFQITNHSNRPQRFWIDPPQGAAHPRINKNYQAAQAKKERKAQKDSNNLILSSEASSASTSSKFSHEIRGNCTIKLTPDMGVIPPNSTITVSAVLTLTKPGNHFIDIEVYLPDLEAAALVALGEQPITDTANLLNDVINEGTTTPPTTTTPPNLSQRLSIVTNAVGPAVSVNTKLLDLGVIPLNEEGEGRITVSNNNPVPIVLRVYDPESQHRKSTDEADDAASASSTVIERYACLPTTAKLRPGASVDVTIFRRGLKPEHIQEFIHFAVEGGQITPVEVHALVQKPSASITPSIVNYGIVHRDVPVEKEVLLSNHSPIDLQYALHVVGGSGSPTSGGSFTNKKLKDAVEGKRPTSGEAAPQPPYILLPPPGVLRAGQSDLPLRIIATFYGTASGPQTALVVLTSPQLDAPIPVELVCEEVSQLVVSLDILVPPRTGPKSAAEVTAATTNQKSPLYVAGKQFNQTLPSVPRGGGALTPFINNTVDDDPTNGLIRLTQTAKDFIRDVVLNLIEASLTKVGEKTAPPSPIAGPISPAGNDQRRPSTASSRPTTMLTPRTAALSVLGSNTAKLRPYCPHVTVPFAAMTDDRPFVSTSAVVRFTNQSGCSTKYSIAPLLYHLEGTRTSHKSNLIGADAGMINTSTVSSTVNSVVKPSSAPAAGGGLKAIRSNNTLSASGSSNLLLNSTKRGASKKQQQQAFEVPTIKPLETNSQVKQLDGREDVEAHENAKLSDASDLLVDGKGCSVLVTNGEGPLRPFATQDVLVTLMSNIPGLYKDKLRVNVEGMPPVDLDVELSVSGKVVILDPATSGLAISGDALAVAQAQATASASSATAARSTLPRLMLPTVVAGAKKVSRRLRLTSRCPRDVEVYARFVNAEQFYTLQIVERELLGTPRGNGVTTDMLWSEAGDQPDFDCSKRSTDTRTGGGGGRGLEVVLETPQLGTKDFFALAAGLDIVADSGVVAGDKNSLSQQGQSPTTIKEHSVCTPSRFLMKALESTEVVVEYYPPPGSTNDWKAVLVVASRIATTTYNDKFIVDEYYRRYAQSKGFVPYSRSLAAESLVTNEKKAKSVNVRGVSKASSRIPHINRPRIIKDSVIIDAVSDELSRAENLIRTSIRKDQQASMRDDSGSANGSPNNNNHNGDDAANNSSDDETNAIVSAGGNLSEAVKMDLEVQRRQKEAKARLVADEEERTAVRSYVKNRRCEIQRESEEYFTPIEVLVVAKNVQPWLTADPAGEVTFPLCTSAPLTPSTEQATLYASTNAISIEKRNHRTLRLTNNNTTSLTFQCAFSSPNPLSPLSVITTQSIQSQDGIFFIKNIDYVSYDGQQDVIGADGENLTKKMKGKTALDLSTSVKKSGFVSSTLDGTELYTILPNDTMDITICLNALAAETYVANRSKHLLTSGDTKDAATLLHRLTAGDVSESELSSLTDSQYQKLLLAAARQNIEGSFTVTFVDKNALKSAGAQESVSYFQTFPLKATLNVPYLTPTPNQALFRPMGTIKDGHPQTYYTQHIKLVNYSIVDADFCIEHVPSQETTEKNERGFDSNIQKVLSLEMQSQLQPLQSTLSPPSAGAQAMTLPPITSSNDTNRRTQTPNNKNAKENTAINLPPIGRLVPGTPIPSGKSVINMPEHKVKHLFKDVKAIDDPTRFFIHPRTGRVPAATIGGAPGEITIDIDFEESAKTFFESTFKVVTKSAATDNTTAILPSPTFVLRGESYQNELKM